VVEHGHHGPVLCGRRRRAMARLVVNLGAHCGRAAACETGTTFSRLAKKSMQPRGLS
jgi:hypothetical protein